MSDTSSQPAQQISSSDAAADPAIGSSISIPSSSASSGQQQEQEQEQEQPPQQQPSSLPPPPTPEKILTAPNSAASVMVSPPNEATRNPSGLVPDLDQYRNTGGSSPSRTGSVDNAAVYQPQHQAQPPRELFLRFRIQGIEKGKRDLSIRFDAITNLPHFRSSSYPNLLRTYRELSLYALALTLSSPATIVPALPLPSTTAGGLEDPRILRLMLARWFSRVLADPVLRDNPETRNFVEADFTYSPTPPGAGSSSAARKRFQAAINSATSVAMSATESGFGSPNGVLATSASSSSRASGGSFSILGLGVGSKGLSTSRSVYDDDEELVAARAEVTRLEMQFADAAEASEKLALSRRALSAALADLSVKFSNLAAVEEVRPCSMRLGLPHALRKAGAMSRSVGELGEALSNTELITLGDGAAYQSINARAAKEAMLARNALVEEHHGAQKIVVAKKREAEHLKTQRNLRADRVDDALEDLEEAKRHEQALAQNLRKISAHLHTSLKSHSKYAHQDLQQALLEHARGSLMYQKQILAEMEALQPELRPKLSHAKAAVDSQAYQITSNGAFEGIGSGDKAAAETSQRQPYAETVEGQAAEQEPPAAAKPSVVTPSIDPPAAGSGQGAHDVGNPEAAAARTMISGSIYQSDQDSGQPRTSTPRQVGPPSGILPPSTQNLTTPPRPNPWSNRLPTGSLNSGHSTPPSSQSPHGVARGSVAGGGGMTQSFYHQPSPSSTNGGGLPPEGTDTMSKSMFVDPGAHQQQPTSFAANPFARSAGGDALPSTFGTMSSSGLRGGLNSGGGGLGGRSRISASEAARSLAGTF